MAFFFSSEKSLWCFYFRLTVNLLPWKSMESLQERHLSCFEAEKLQSLLGPGAQIVHLP